eukprot:jgi/Psemu1/27745/gm1.27745_g
MDNNANAADTVSTMGTNNTSSNVVVTQQETATQEEDFENDAPDNDDTDADALPASKDFTSPAAKSALLLGEPPWSAVGNPGMWDQEYCFRPKFDRKKEDKSLHYRLPSGCTPPIPGEGTKRKFNKDWDFYYYTGWIPEDDEPPAYLSGRHVLPSMDEAQAARSNKREVDSWRCPILLSAAAPPSFGSCSLKAEDDPPVFQEEAFYSKVSRWSSNYANHDHTGKGNYVGSRITLKDVVRFDDIVFLHGALLDGRNENICYRWVHSDALYSHQVVAQTTMSWYRWRQIKANLKLNCNLKARRVQMADMPTTSLTASMKLWFTEKAGDDLCMDESLWPYYGFGGPMVDDVDRVRPRGYLHTHKYYKKPAPLTMRGCLEVHDIMSKFVLPYAGMGKLWKCPPCLTVDNFFNGDSILNWMGERRLGMIGTVARNKKVPKGVPHKYFHKENASQSGQKIACVARMCNPVTLVKEVPAKAESGKFTKAYCRVHCSFQSTGSCDLGSVNSLSTNSFFLHRKERGRGNDKRFWAIEMNCVRELYPRTYGKLDQIDSSISRANIGYRKSEDEEDEEDSDEGDGGDSLD